MHALPSSGIPTVEAWRQVVLGLVRHHAATAAHLERTTTLDPTWVPALCLRGFALLFKGRRAFRDDAADWASRARAVLDAGGGRPGDELLIEALLAWARDDAWGAEAALDRRLQMLPVDLFTVKLQHGLLFMMGQSRVMRDRIEARLATWPEDDPDHGYVLGATVFARVECGDYAAAHEARLRWGEGPIDDSWGLHAVAHLLHEQGHYGEALEWLDQRQARWADCDRFGNHLDWHRALLHLQLGGPDRALALFDGHLRGVFDGDYRDMSNAVSILWRLEVLGIDVGCRWIELAEACVTLCGDHGSAFADAHYVLAQLHGGAPETVERWLSSLARLECEGYQATVVRDVGHPLCEAMRCWRSDPARALAVLRSVESRLARIGGSHAQRSLFEDMHAHLATAVEG